ncbi:hypothetical protein T459_26928 [Capsicum annuum]|uniref:F-box domain-containing protein n=1 Tax=Capsicum annuum TaxID=4072 RepID=A0A2G2YD09_CAPAN|nr:hypothetical protein T459_26928 [Capsicum annuum]
MGKHPPRNLLVAVIVVSFVLLHLPQISFEFSMFATIPVVSLKCCKASFTLVTECTSPLQKIIKSSAKIRFSIGYYCFIMYSNGETHACQSVPLDQLSSLPKNIIDDIRYVRLYEKLNSVQHLDLSFDPSKLPKLPSSIFNCLQLMHLSLKGCSIRFAPPAFKGFDRLISLELRNISISTKLLENLISNCPLLDQLWLHDNVGSDVIEINAPMLRAFYYFTKGEGSISLKNVPRLVKLTLEYMHYHVGTRYCFDSFCYLEHLEVKAAGEVPIRLLFDFNCLKHLHLDKICLAKLDVLSFVLFFIRSSQYLQYLEIKDLIGENTVIYKMLPKDKQLCSATLSLDVISNLPAHVLDDILICLPLRDAVRTSILSNKWRFNWCRLPAIMLDQTLWDTTNENINFVTRFTDIIYHIMAFHVGPITKFTLSIADMENYLKIDYLISFLSRNGIRHLVLQFPKDKPYRLPSSFFTCLQMRHLSLHYCSIQPPSTFEGFDELTSLELYEVKISSEVLGSLISRSLLLEKLVLQISSILNHIQINAPKLKFFDFTGNVELMSLKKVPVLGKLSLVDTVKPSWKAGRPDLSKYFESFPTLEHLHLNYQSVQFLAAGSSDIATKLSSPLNCLKYLRLSVICLDELVELSIALCLIRSSPYLQDIQMEFDYLALDDFSILPLSGDVVNEIPASFTGVTLNHLRSVKLVGISGTKTEIEIIKLLLAVSPMLVRMLIQPKMANESAETKLKVLAEITKFPRASTKAEVDYRLDDNRV